MRNLSKRDAELFVKACSHSFMSSAINYFLPNENEFLRTIGIKYTDIMKLSELGLIFNDGTIALNININNEPRILLENNDLIMLISSASGNLEKASIRQYPFTEVGRELSTMISERASDEDFLEYGRLLSRNKPQKISIHRVISRKDNSVEYNEIDLISSETSVVE